MSTTTEAPAEAVRPLPEGDVLEQVRQTVGKRGRDADVARNMIVGVLGRHRIPTI